jgi:hypothetical protein
MRNREIKTNALYETKNGVVCRVQKKLKNNKFLVRHHKMFTAIVDAPALKRIGYRKVAKYLAEAGIK